MLFKARVPAAVRPPFGTLLRAQDTSGAAQAHTDRFGALLATEFDEEKRSCEARLLSWPRARLQRDGLALFGLRARLGEQLGRSAVLRLTVRTCPAAAALPPRRRPRTPAVASFLVEWSVGRLALAKARSCRGTA